MFKRAKKIISNKVEIGNYIEGFDVYNSLLIRLLLDPNTERVDYEVDNYEYRPDLIAKDIYGSSDYMAILLISTMKGPSDFKKGEIIKVIPKAAIDRILESL